MTRSLCLLMLAACQPADADLCEAGLDLDLDGHCDAERVDWSVDASVPAGSDRANIYGYDPDQLETIRVAGMQHAFVWPVTVSGVYIPYRPLLSVFGEGGDPALQSVARLTLGWGSMQEIYDWLGVATFIEPEGGEPAGYALPPGASWGDPIGAGVVDTEWGEALTFSCATCHTTNLFGHTVVGMSNRQSRANAFFAVAKDFFPQIPAEAFREATGANELDMELFDRINLHLPLIGARPPVALGLDTSLAQVALSLARRAPDAWASPTGDWASHPRPSALDTLVADSKPTVWWTLKHKTRWLADGSIVAGNPVFTNFLWNELGRGTDLRQLQAWLADNQQVVDELTVAVFATEAPRWTDILGTDGIDLDAARRGQAHFDDLCASCHGAYDKAWDDPDLDGAPLEARVATVGFTYHEQTPVMDVGTDPQRAQGMQHFADALNGLEISKAMGTIVEPQSGYVPPPLEGVWARYPYLHNNSVPTLCDLLKPVAERTATFYQGPTDDAATDFDADCVGYPTGDAVPESWTTVEGASMDTSLPGLSNSGHDEMLLDSAGGQVLDDGARADLIAFLKTL